MTFKLVFARVQKIGTGYPTYKTYPNVKKKEFSVSLYNEPTLSAILISAHHHKCTIEFTVRHKPENPTFAYCVHRKLRPCVLKQNTCRCCNVVYTVYMLLVYCTVFFLHPMLALFNTGLHEEYFFMQCVGPFYSISVGAAETLIDTVRQCIARVQYSCTLSICML